MCVCEHLCLFVCLHKAGSTRERICRREGHKLASTCTITLMKWAWPSFSKAEVLM